MGKAQQLLDEGNTVNDVAKELGIKPDTLGKAVAAGKLHALKKRLEKFDARCNFHDKKRAQSGRRPSPDGHGSHQ